MSKSCLEEGCTKEAVAKGQCPMHYRRKQRAADPEAKAKAVAYTKAWKAANKEKHAAQQARKHEREKDEQNAYVAKWKRANWDTYKNYLYARKQRVKQATPPWVDLEVIEEIYRLRPEGCHVDHIEPINGKDICGLHVPWNLQYLTESDNLKKSNKR